MAHATHVSTAGEIAAVDLACAADQAAPHFGQTSRWLRVRFTPPVSSFWRWMATYSMTLPRFWVSRSSKRGTTLSADGVRSAANNMVAASHSIAGSELD